MVKTFKLLRDPKFLEQLTDVVGLYLNPPQQAIVLCVDEKSQIQALERMCRQPSGGHLEMRVGVEEYPTAVSFDGQRFVAIEAVESPANQRQAIPRVAELARRVPRPRGGLNPPRRTR